MTASKNDITPFSHSELDGKLFGAFSDNELLRYYTLHDRLQKQFNVLRLVRRRNEIILTSLINLQFNIVLAGYQVEFYAVPRLLG